MGSNNGRGLSRQRKEFWVEVDQDLLQVRRQATIGMLPDYVLLEIFSFYVEEAYELYADSVFVDTEEVETWKTLVHVCRRWRNVVFASPNRLDLRVVCTSRRPVREMLGIWPTLPIIIDEFWESDSQLDNHERPCIAENIIAALEHRDRICQIMLGQLPLPLLGGFTAMMHEPFPALTHLYLNTGLEPAPDLPDSFLDGSAPRLRHLSLMSIPLPALPKLLSSTNNLVELSLLRIPHSGYITPETMVTCLSSLTRLENFSLSFSSPRSCPDGTSRHPLSLTRIDLPALTRFTFRGVNAYLEDLTSQINAPLLFKIRVTVFNQLRFDTSRLRQFIGRIESLEVLHLAEIQFSDTRATLDLLPYETIFDGTNLTFRILSNQSEWQLSSLAEVCGSPSSPFPLSSLESLILSSSVTRPGHWYDDMDNIQWLELFQPFASVKDLYISETLVPRVARAFQELTGEVATEVLPALESILVEGHQQLAAVQQAIGPFIVARQLSGHPVAVYPWKRNSDND